MFNDDGYTKTKFCPISLGVAFGLANGFCLLVLAWAAMWFGYGVPLVEMIGSFYHGYAATYMGGLFGALWGFIDGFIFGAIVGVIYNFCMCRCCGRNKNKDLPRV